MMTRARLLACACLMTLTTFPVWAQTAPDLGPRCGYGPMWGGWGWGGWGWFPGMILGPLTMLIVVGIIVALVAWLVRGFGRAEPYGHSRTALDVLEQRFARGEIDKAEFEDKRKLLRS